MITRFALSFVCIELDRDKIYEVTGLYILLALSKEIFSARGPLRPGARAHAPSAPLVN